MTVMQIVSLLLVVAAVAYSYATRIKWPSVKANQNPIRQIESVLSIRDSNPSPEVKEACTALLQALLQ